MERNLDIRLLRTFVMVSETGTVSRAADRLARTQAAVSMQLQRLELDLNAKLLLRSPKGVTLTDAGETFLAYARKTIALGEDMRRQLEGRKLSGRVRLGMVEDLAVTRLPSVIADFRRRHPSVEIELTSSNSADLAKILYDERADIVVADPARCTVTPSSYLSRQLIWCASRMMELEDGADLPLIIFEGSCAWQDKMLSVLAEKGIKWYSGCRVSSFAALISGLRAGLGVGLLLPEGLPSDCHNLQGQFNLPTAPIAEFGVYVSRNPPLLVQELAAFLRAGF
ncbi:LysR family transcriptional regulator [Mesorhizobium qingshengii]|uniref:DNA-binding transcriptional regulator, LysR family n=1 Tax=Mesorhizobium qingshengii TaxID=1165689 RepID=A0A1G5ZAS4_9HYPH|nr:LysR family transcriptional regulator [Mesorhizobium qingshengii]SDA91615.1 DNA-binding transcriptional regulator, LysR family [Mesorhizobium qingshengii]